jgi:thioredoxin-dependent peroxiredoxin
MAQIKFKGNPANTVGNLPQAGSPAPDFKLTKSDLTDMSLKDLRGKRVVLNIFPSIDTPVCATSVRKFNSEADKLANTVILCVSEDLPFAHSRFCGAEGLKNVVTASDFRTREFGKKYGVEITNGPLAGLLARSVVVLDETGEVFYTEQVPEITREPNYANALKLLTRSAQA